MIYWVIYLLIFVLESNMKKKYTILYILDLNFITALTSCSEKELTHEEKLKEIVEVYVADMLKTEQRN